MVPGYQAFESIELFALGENVGALVFDENL